MSAEVKTLTESHPRVESAKRLDAASVPERVITLATTADRHRLRGELLRLIIKNEARRKGMLPALNFQEMGTTEGSANSRTGAAES